MDEISLEQFESFWNQDKHCYVLEEVRDSSGNVSGHVIVDLQSNRMVLICSHSTAQEVVRRMLEAGVPVGNRYDPAIRKAFMRRRLGSK